MAQIEPMDIDGIENDYEDKENSILHTNVLPKVPSAEKGYEELDVSELSMKLRYSITPASSPLSKSYTANCKDNKNIGDRNNSLNISNADLTSSLNSTLTNSDLNNENKVYSLHSENLTDTNRNVLIPKSLNNDDNNITITISANIDENFSIPSTSSSIPHTPEATTPTKELPKDGSPIMRGLRSVLSMFKPQSPQPSHEQHLQGDSPSLQSSGTHAEDSELHPVQVSTPLRPTNTNSPKSISPLKDSLVFNDDLEKELQWKDDSTILFKEEKIPKHKLFLQDSVALNIESKIQNKTKEEGNVTLEYMDISYNDTIVSDKTMTNIEIKTNPVLESGALESDGEFVDCETTYTKDEVESLLKSKVNFTTSINTQQISTEVNTVDFEKDISSLNLPLPTDSSNSLASNDVPSSEVLANDTCTNDNLVFNDALQETFSVIHSEDKSSCEIPGLQANTDVNISNTILIKNSNYSNIEMNEINIISSNPNMTEIVEHKEEQTKHNTLVSHENESYSVLQSINNGLEHLNEEGSCTEAINNITIFKTTGGDYLKTKREDIEIRDTIQLRVVDENAKSKKDVCTNISNIATVIYQKNHETMYSTHNTINEKTDELINTQVFDPNIQNKAIEQSSKDNETLDMSFGQVPKDNCREIRIHKNNIEVEKCENEINDAENIFRNAKIILPDSENNKKLPIDITLPTDSNFDKDIDGICEVKINPGDVKQVNKVLQNSETKINEGLLSEISNEMKKIQTAKTVDKTLDYTSDVNYEFDSTLQNVNDECKNNIIACVDNTLDKDISFEYIEKEEEGNKSILSQRHEIYNSIVVDNIIDKIHNNSLQPSNTFETLENYGNLSENVLSLQCDTNSNSEKFNEDVSLNIKLSDSFETKNKLQTSPLQSLFVSNTGYSIDFDDIVNPFATKTKIRQSPTPENKSHDSSATEDSNITQNISSKLNKSSKRKSYPIKKPINTKKNSLNATFDSSIKKDRSQINDDTSEKTKDIPNSLMDLVNRSDQEIENETDGTVDNKIELIQDDFFEEGIKSAFLEDKRYKVNNITDINNVIYEIPKTFNNNSNMSENVECFENISNNMFSLQCDTNSNLEKLNKDICPNIEQLLNPFEIKNKLQTSPPTSPLLSNTGCNIGFNDIENPFATKTKIRQSPTPENQSQDSLTTYENNITRKVSSKPNKASKRKSYPIKNPSNTNKNSLNATFDYSIEKEAQRNEETTSVNTKIETFDLPFNAHADGLSNINNIVNKPDKEIENKINLLPARDVTKSVFNCPEINDVHFCSFWDKQKTMSSDSTIPSDDITIDNKEGNKSKIESLDSINPETIIDQQIPNVDTNIETSVCEDSKNSNIKEVNTEDEDTATFDETTDFIESNKENANCVKDMLAYEVSHAAKENDNVDKGEMFIDAEAFEFLLNQNKSNVIADSGKESLFLKFDPLFTKRVSSDGIIAALKRVQNNQSTPKKLNKLQLEMPSEMPGPSQQDTFNDVTDDANIQAMSKPMMVVNPAINSIVSPRKVSTPIVNRQSLTFTSPAMAVIDKLLSLSGNSLINDHITPASSPVKQHNETDIAITQLREMLADKDIHVHNLRSESKELRDRLSNLEEHVKSLEVESAERLKKVNDLNERLLEKIKMNKSMANVVEEYERTIASLIAQIEQEKKNNAAERIVLIKERDEQTAHLASMEVSFNDLHSKYEKSKQLIYSMKANEETYKKSIKEFEESLTKMQNNYELLKQHATSKLNHANQELEKFNRAHEAEILKLNALIKRKELHITSLEETLAQKTKANEELTAICDELINKVG